MIDVMPKKYGRLNLPNPNLPVRAAIFQNVVEVDRAIDRLLQVGFTPEQLTVVTSEETIKAHFSEFQHEQPSGTNAPYGAIAGSSIGAAVLGGMSLLILSLVPGGVGVVAASGMAAGTGGVIGGFIGAMATRGFETEISEFYSQALSEGEILLAVECQEGDIMANLAIAEQIFDDLHQESVPLAEG